MIFFLNYVKEILSKTLLFSEITSVLLCSMDHPIYINNIREYNIQYYLHYVLPTETTGSLSVTSIYDNNIMS